MSRFDWAHEYEQKLAGLPPVQRLVIDPPWMHNDRGIRSGTARQYSGMSLKQIGALPLPPLAEDAYVFLWHVESMAAEAYEVIHHWSIRLGGTFDRLHPGPLGLTQKTALIWEKTTKGGEVRIGTGHHFRNAHERCIVLVRGKPKRLVRDIPTVFREARAGLAHSQKPNSFYQLVDRFAAGTAVELFARRQWADWVCIGRDMPKSRKKAA